MLICPDCNSEIDVEEEDVDEGDTLECDECGKTLRVTSTSPIELEAADADDDDDDFDGDDEDDEEEFDEGDGEESAEEDWH